VAFETVGLTRRQLFQIAALAAGGGSLLSACTSEQIEDIRNRPIRKNIATLAPNDPIVTTYAAAISAMQALPSTDTRNWENQAQIHNKLCRHDSWLILPWHRAYLWYFEEICRELTGRKDFALPYWNWTTSPQIPAVFWDSSSALFHSPRTATSSSSAPAFMVGPTVMSNILNETNFLAFAGDAVPLNDTAQFGPGAGPLEPRITASTFSSAVTWARSCLHVIRFSGHTTAAWTRCGWNGTSCETTRIPMTPLGPTPNSPILLTGRGIRSASRC
jgi:hypothetical protein